LLICRWAHRVCFAIAARIITGFVVLVGIVGIVVVLVAALVVVGVGVVVVLVVFLVLCWNCCSCWSCCVWKFRINKLKLVSKIFAFGESKYPPLPFLFLLLPLPDLLICYLFPRFTYN